MIWKSALVALLATALVATPAAAEPSAGTWLVGQFADGDHLLKAPDMADSGLTADGVYALAAAGVGRSTAEKAAGWLAKSPQFETFIGDGTAESYVGGLTKLALVAQTLGQDPRAFGGVDLLARLTALQEPSGRFRDKTDPEYDMTNAFTQALAIIVLKRADQAVGPAVEFAASTQCSGAGFPIVFGEPECKSDVDATAMVLQALLAAGEKSVSAKALDWLVEQQKADGGFPAAGSAGSNANSTGLVVGALVAGGRVEAADKAVAYLKTLQAGCTGPQPGAIAYDSTGFELYPAIRATTQAMLGLARVSLADVSASSATPGVPAINCTTPAPSQPAAPAAPAESPVVDPPLAATGPDQAVPLTLFGSFAVLAGAVLVFVSRRRKVVA
ncbi:MAG: LPXTG cell wall anchor domain-containing protein [Saccharothrix sp.]|nr:LPXTG cell wall anchor domain-containing protein [Saccharothrix sp.]